MYFSRKKKYLTKFLSWAHLRRHFAQGLLLLQVQKEETPYLLLRKMERWIFNLLSSYQEVSLFKRRIGGFTSIWQNSVQETKEPAVEEAEAVAAPWEQILSSPWSVISLRTIFIQLTICANTVVTLIWAAPLKVLIPFWGSFVLLWSAVSTKNTLFQLALDLCFILSTYLTTQHYYE